MEKFRIIHGSLILLFLTITIRASGQSGRNFYTVQWTEPRNVLDSASNPVPSLDFEQAWHIKDLQYLPAAVIGLPGVVTDFKITDYQSESLNAEEQKLVPANRVSSGPRILIRHTSGKPYTYVFVVPLRNGVNGIEKLTRFEYSYQSTPVQTSAQTTPQAKAMKISSSSPVSVLSSGTWYKLKVTKTGMHKIDYAFLKSLNIDVDNIDPRNIRIFGNGGGMLPQTNSDFRHDDLVENPIYVAGETDGRFNEGSDYALFYAQGPDTWSYNSALGMFTHTKNIYSDAAYYFLTIGPGTGRRIEDQVAASSPQQTITTYDERMFHEVDNVNILHSGREWYGEMFDYELEKSFQVSYSGITPGTPMKFRSAVMARSFNTSYFNIYLNGQTSPFGSHSILGVSTASYHPEGTDDVKKFTINSFSGPDLTFRYRFNKGSYSSAQGYLNYFEINFTRNLNLYGNETPFRSISSTAQSPSAFVVGSASPDMMVWDVTDPVNPERVQATYDAGTGSATFVAITDQIKEFIAFKGNSFTIPEPAGQVENQNLHAIGTAGLPDMIIVTHPLFLSQASRLAASKQPELDAEVVLTEQIYNEFSSGAQDITAIRDFMRMLYERSTPSDKVKYLLLFGDCSFDYKPGRTPGNTNFVPVYESRQSLHPIYSYSSDDYFGFLDPYEGLWREDTTDADTLDLGIGRFPVRNTLEAEYAVNKIIGYSTRKETQGKWKNKITFIADDGDNNLHLSDANKLAAYLELNYPMFNLNKVYLDAFPQISNPGGETCPAAQEAVNEAVERGSFIVNYTGHGGERVWTQEGILQADQVRNWSNSDKLPLFITATCEFGRYDYPGLTSGAEELFLNPQGGAIGVICSTRPVYESSNMALNTQIYKYAFAPVNGQMPRLGDILKVSKNHSIQGNNNRNYALLSDPSLRLAYPIEDIVLTKLNGKSVASADTLKALSKITIEGEIRDGAGSKINDYNGSVYVTVYDKPSIIKTFGTQQSSSTTFSLMNNLIYEGVASVTGGSFTLSFVVPKDISYQFDKGKISFYSLKDGYLTDAHGYNNSIVVGGSDTSFAADNTPPAIKLYMNDESFVFGGLTSQNSLLLAKLFDENGINIAGQGIGHDITATLDNKMEVLVLNDYYTAEKNNYKQGAVEYPLKDLAPGPHSLKFKCWDTYNNSSESYLEFVVANSAKIALNHILNYPNPFSTFTTFHFDHNRAGDDLDVMVQIYTVSGKLVKTLDARSFFSNSHFSDLSWDGRDDFGDKIGKGVYVYKVQVKSLRDGSHISNYQKLVILN